MKLLNAFKAHFAAHHHEICILRKAIFWHPYWLNFYLNASVWFLKSISPLEICDR